MNELNGKEVNGVPIEISLAKPPSDKKKKEEMLRAREKRMMVMLQQRGQWVLSYGSLNLILLINFVNTINRMNVFLKNTSSGYSIW